MRVVLIRLFLYENIFYLSYFPHSNYIKPSYFFYFQMIYSWIFPIRILSIQKNFYLIIAPLQIVRKQ